MAADEHSTPKRVWTHASNGQRFCSEYFARLDVNMKPPVSAPTGEWGCSNCGALLTVAGGSGEIVMAADEHSTLTGTLSRKEKAEWGCLALGCLFLSLAVRDAAVGLATFFFAALALHSINDWIKTARREQ